MWISHQKILIVKMVFQQIYPRGIYLVAKFLLLMVVTFRFNNYVSARKSSSLAVKWSVKCPVSFSVGKKDKNQNLKVLQFFI